MKTPERIAYLISQYPAVSHTFILREVVGLRRRGVDIETISINEPDRAPQAMTAEERDEAARTFFVKRAGAPAAAWTLLKLALRKPLALAAAVRESLRLAGWDARRIPYAAFYLAEAAIVAERLSAQGIGRLHAHFANSAATVAMLAAPLAGAEFSFSMHGPDEFFDTAGASLRDKVKSASLVRCIGSFARSQLMLLCAPDEWSKLLICPLGVVSSTAPLPASRSADEPVEILCVGRLVPAKGQAVLLRAFAKLIGSGRCARLRLVGAGPSRPQLEAEAARLGIAASVIFEGALNQDAVRERYKRADVFALASFAEGIPVVLMEAMAAGIPCVSTHIAGIHELIRDGRDGLLVSPSDEETLVDALTRLADDPELRQRLGEAGRQRVAQRYDLDINLDQLADIFRRTAAAAVVLMVLAAPSMSHADARITVGSQALGPEVSRFGVNLGRQAAWGAEQLLSQVLPNPGFEPAIRRRVARVESSSAGLMIAMPSLKAGGPARLRAVSADAALAVTTQDGRVPVPSASGLRAGDFAVVELEDSRAPPDPWLDKSEGGGRTQASKQRRPDSPGSSSVLMSPGGGTARLNVYMDSLGGKAGRMLPLTGRWTLSFWAKRAAAAPRLHARLRRLGGSSLLDRDIPVEAQWKKFTFELDAEAPGPAGAIELSFSAKESGDILIDDADLRVSGAPGPFRPEAVAALKRLNPGYLRDWQEQSGDSLANRLAAPQARGPVATGLESARWTYSLPEFLRLCREVGAEPWIVAPTSLSEDEWRGLGRFLHDSIARDGHHEVIVEFGNENWNSTFDGAAVRDPGAHGIAAERAFRALAAGSGDDARIVATVNGQHASPALSAAYASSSPSARALALAPYYLHSLPAGLSRAQAMALLFSGDEGRLASAMRAQSARGRTLVVAEINSHAASGDALPEDRTAIVAGAASGAALALHMLETRSAGVRIACAYTFAGLDAPMAAGRVRLWGLYRSLAGLAVARPTALALELLNTAAVGRPVSASSDNPALVAAAYRDGDAWALVAVNTSPSVVRARVRFPGRMTGARRTVLASKSPDAVNEESAQVRLEDSDAASDHGDYLLDLPAFGLASLKQSPR